MNRFSNDKKVRREQRNALQQAFETARGVAVEIF